MPTEHPPSSDVRMRGFSARHTVEEATAWVDGMASPRGGERIACVEAAGRILAADVRSPINVPSFDRSAMDGYAVRACDTEGASDYNPLSLQVRGESWPGRPSPAAVDPKAAVRIMTGAPIPSGADSVVPAEFAQEKSGSVEIFAAMTPGKNIGRVGEDIAAGSTVLAAGRKLRPQDLGLLASIGQATIEVVRRPKVRILVTGNELASPGTALGPHQIYEANSSMLRALAIRDGGEVEPPRRIPDDRPQLEAALREEGADVVLVSGGSSVGSEDFAPVLLRELGTLDIHGIAMRPSSPAGMGTIGSRLVFLLPGNPVSCLCAYDVFAGRAIRRLFGQSGGWPYRRIVAPTARKISSIVGRVDYCRVRLEDDRVDPLAISGASILSSTVRADGFVIVPASSEGHPPGAEVEVWLYD